MTEDAENWPARQPFLWGYVTLFLLVGGLGGWSVLTTLSGAIVAPGQVEVSQSRQIVQHPDGGVVAVILVVEGAAVVAGDILLRLDGRQIRSEFAIVENQLHEVRARRARLEAERDAADAVVFPADLAGAASSQPDLAELLDGQARLFAAHRETLAQSVDQRRERIAQINNQIAGILAQETAVRAQIALIKTELATQRELLAQQLVQATKVSAIEQDLAQIEGRAGELTAELAEARGRIAEIEIEISGLASQQREAAETELRDIVAREAELAEQRRALADRIDQLDIRAPVAGLVLGLAVTTPQSVIRPADPLLYIVPQDRPLLVAARVPVTHVDEVRPGQEVRLVFSSLPARTTPEIVGTVTLVSADALIDDRTGAAYYRAEITIDVDALNALGEVSIVPGMPVDAFLRTADQTPLAYLLKPFTDYFRTALRES